MWTQRSSGILCHPTSLPGPEPIGTLGAEAHWFAEQLAEMGCRWWQLLPVNPTGYADSPYQSPSTFAGNPLLVSLALGPATEGVSQVTDRVDYAQLIPEKTVLLNRLAERLRTCDDWQDISAGLSREQYQIFCQQQKGWLDLFALFATLKHQFEQRPWWEWPPPFRFMETEALQGFRENHQAEIEQQAIIQYLFDHQWQELRRHCRQLGVKLIGDLPLFVAHDSADVWGYRDLFLLGHDGQPQLVSGVPPDYFSPTGQRWGNPLYDWSRHQADGYAWWTQRMARVLELFDQVRIDHFRGFEAAWHIPASSPTAVEGEWRPGPGMDLFEQMTARLGKLPIVAEDLGVITPPVEELRRGLGYPGMKVLQFGFGTEAVHAPSQIRADTVAYTGTHDNDTAVGWFYGEATPDQKRRALNLLDSNGLSLGSDMIRVAWESTASLSVTPLQDLLNLGSSARMNTPSTTGENWRWRIPSPGLVEDVVPWMAELNRSSRRSFAHSH